MQTYKVTLINKSKNFEQTIDIPATEAILGEAFEHGIKIPFECVVGACAACEGKLLSGSVDQSEQIFLDDEQLAQGYVMTCVAKPTSDCTIEIEIGDYI
ncbi:MAG: 2Fe-2S iron-sulfur cluster binding domain-containing protein [Cyanobacteria bacterium SBLK]|nr:2Fe-2S iron-sulfur cluster binding domain-containing protein [Cyanobacteria bacterium SBLK]